MEAIGFEPLQAEDGRDGVEVFRAHMEQIRVVLLDLTMPGMGGDVAFQHLRKIRPDVPIVLMSGFTEQHAASQLANEKLTGFLQKPFRLHDMRQKIRAAIEEHE